LRRFARSATAHDRAGNGHRVGGHPARLGRLGHVPQRRARPVETVPALLGAREVTSDEPDDGLLLNKIELLPYVDFDTERHAADFARVSPAAKLLYRSAVTGAGMPAWFDWLSTAVAARV